VLAASVICGLGDLVGINNFGFEPVRIEVFEASGETAALTERIEERWGRMESQDSTEDLAPVPVLADRELRRDPDYVPAYRPAPAITRVEVGLGDEEQRLVAGLIATGVYGETEGEAVRAAFMRWCNVNLTRVRRPQIAFSD